VRAEEGGSVGLEELLILIEHAVQPWQKLLGAVVGVKNDWDAVCGRNGADVVGTSDSTLDRSALVLVVDALSGEVCGTTLAHLEDDGRLAIPCGLERGNDRRGGGYVDGGDGVALRLSVLEEVVDIVTVDDTGPEVRELASARDHSSGVGVGVTYFPLRTSEA
jgi:hypothetical protein